jgi:hypothetical protein
VLLHAEFVLPHILNNDESVLLPARRVLPYAELVLPILIIAECWLPMLICNQCCLLLLAGCTVDALSSTAAQVKDGAMAL